MAFPLLFLNGGGETSSIAIIQSPYYWLFCGIYIALFYINGYFLIPRFLFRKKYVDYFIIAFVLFSCVYVVKPFDKLLRNTDNFIHRSHINWQSAAQNNFMSPPGANNQPNGSQPGYPPDSNHTGLPPDTAHMPPGGHRHRWANGWRGDHDQWQAGPSSDSGHIWGHHHRSHNGWQGGDSVGWNGGPPYRRHHPGDHWYNSPKRTFFIDSNSLFIFLMIIAISTAIKTVQQWQLTEQRAARAEADKASAELSFLKAQINPHFLFNTLNNIYTLAVTHDEHAADSIMKLSNIMRYVTDDVTVDFVPLQSEIDCIGDYIELQRLRLNEDTPISFTVQGNTETKIIPPLVLMTFVENVFKYGISKQEPSPITIDITVNDEGISFFCQNTIFIRDQETQRAGIGIKNTKQRLEHLYPGRHLLYITNDEKLYTVQLNLQN